MEVKITYDQDRIPPGASAQIESNTADCLRIETLYEMDKFDEAMEFFRKVNNMLKRFFEKNPEEKIYSDSTLLVNKNTISVCVERKTL